MPKRAGFYWPITSPSRGRMPPRPGIKPGLRRRRRVRRQAGPGVECRHGIEPAVEPENIFIEASL